MRGSKGLILLNILVVQVRVLNLEILVEEVPEKSLMKHIGFICKKDENENNKEETL